MPEISTPKSESSSSKCTGRPKKSTIEFIRQFARCYTCQTGIYAPLADIVVN